MRRNIRIALKFCGSCNPEIDLSALAGKLKQYAGGRADLEFVPFGSPGANLVIILCGCRRACANRDDIKSQAKYSVVITGENLEGIRQDEKQLLKHVIREIERLASPVSD